MSFLVAIDGPAGSGKGTIADLIAKKLNYIHVDTGAMYRCITLYVLKQGIEKSNKYEIIKAMDNIEIDEKLENNKQVVILNGEDVTNKIRTQEINNTVSDIAGILEVREKLVLLQRKIAKNKNVVMEGRDIGTTVFPNADVKIFLDATLDVRAQRRYKENIEKGIDTTFEEVKESIIKRDEKDINRKYGALKKADDAVVVDTTELNIEQVVNKIEKIIKDRKEEREIEA